jgi:hypothetical protein
MPRRTEEQEQHRQRLDFDTLVTQRSVNESNRAKKGLKFRSTPAQPAIQEIGTEARHVLKSLGEPINRLLREMGAEPSTSGLARQVRHTGTAVVEKTAGNAANALKVHNQSAGKVSCSVKHMC